MEFIWLNIKQINNKLWHRRAEHTFYIDSTQYWLCTEKTYLELIEIFSINKMEWFNQFSELRQIDKEYRTELIKRMTEEFPKIFNLWEWKKYKSNVLEYKKDYEWLHPTQKPVKLIEDLVQTYSAEWQTILDFTAGSFTTAVAAENTNRKWICIEKDSYYFNVWIKRINEM